MIVLGVFLSCFCQMAFVDATHNPIDVRQYEVSVRPNFSERSIVGETSLRFTFLREGVEQISFPVHELQIQEVFLDSHPTPFSVEKGRVAIPLQPPAKTGDPKTLRITYHGTPRRGIVFGEHSVYTAFDTAHWMICDVDTPGDKATFKLTLSIPKDLKVIASGHEVSQNILPNGLIEVLWPLPRPD